MIPNGGPYLTIKKFLFKPILTNTTEYIRVQTYFMYNQSKSHFGGIKSVEHLTEAIWGSRAYFTPSSKNQEHSKNNICRDEPSCSYVHMSQQRLKDELNGGPYVNRLPATVITHVRDGLRSGFAFSDSQESCKLRVRSNHNAWLCRNKRQ